MLKIIRTVSLLLIASLSLSVFAGSPQRVYEIWEPEPAPNRGAAFGSKSIGEGTPYDEDWELWSTPIGNGYMGANLFGRVDTERIQITEKTLHNRGIYGGGGLTAFADILLEFNHTNVTNYRRSLSLNDAVATVFYEADGVEYSREYFMSYPDNVLAVRLNASRKGAMSFDVRMDIPYLNLQDKRSGNVEAEGSLLRVSGSLPFYNINYEGQLKVLHDGGTLAAEEGMIRVTKADSVTLLFTAGTNFRLSEHIFSAGNGQKLDAALDPHEQLSERISRAEDKGYEALKKDHLSDYRNLFGRVAVNLNAEVSEDPTHVLLEKYQRGESNTYLEELMFQYGRYLLIASSREKSMPSGLQGTWNQYHFAPWTGGYWHNINVQMNYWGALSANLAETFEAYINYFKAYLPSAEWLAGEYIKKHHPERYSDVKGENGWTIGTAATAYTISGPGGHSGPGTGGFTSKLFAEYYYFTQDREFLEEVGYPVLLSMSRFFSKTLKPTEDGLLLVTPSASPEQKVLDKKQVAGKPGHVDESGNYITTGCTFDQAFVWENHNDTLTLAKALGRKDDFLNTIRDEMSRLDPIQIGTSGQIKEYREEQAYSDIGDPKHRHISHLCSLHPGTLLNSSREEWMKAASVTLDLRGSETTGWALAHRMNCRARLGEGEKAREAYQRFIRDRTAPNLWTMHPPFQIDGNLGIMAGVAEMLLQSHEEYIKPLPALPSAWKDGSYEGLVARGNFVFSANWKNGKALCFAITSRSGGECRIKYPAIESVQVIDSDGKAVETTSKGKNKITFASTKGETYRIEFK